MLYFAERATILSRDAHGVRAFFAKTGLVKHQDSLGSAQRVRDELRIGPPHVLLIPGNLTEKPLQPPATAS
jgi:hypothetical protein